MSVQFVTFHLNKTLWGINILQTREVIRQARIFPVPLSTSNIRGLVNLRGQIVTVLDLTESIGYTQRLEDEHDVCIILKTDNELSGFSNLNQKIVLTGEDVVGLLVDEIGEAVMVEEDEIDSTPAHIGEEERRFVHGVVKLRDGLLLLLALDQVLETSA